MLEEKEREMLFMLNRIPGMYYGRLMGMYNYAGSFTDAAKISEREYFASGIFRRSKETEIYEVRRTDEAFISESRRMYESMRKRNIRMIDFTEEEMPERLKAIPDPPAVLFVRGDLPSDGIPSAAVIGSRQCSEYGRNVAAFFGKELAAEGVQVISGMAAGIDSAASEGALCGGDRAFAVLGSGVDICYPASSRNLYNEIRNGKGGIISEFSPDAPGIGYHFILRNRVIAGLCDVLLVIEAKTKSGTATTVQYALEQGKDIFALPGRITDPLGRGCNKLLKDGAFVLTGPEDVLEYLGITGKNAGKTLKEKRMSGLSPEEKRILKCMGADPLHVEDIAERAGVEIYETLNLLSMLELHGNIKSVGSAYFVKIYK